ncbi:MAG: ImmA/IrrE family metallo-endopeptidase [Oscillospiraceae bacterium]
MTGTMALVAAGITSLPVSVAAVADRFGIKIVDFESFVMTYQVTKDELYSRVSYAGFSVLKEGRYICVLNPALCGRPRRKWTAAHEVGHILCGHTCGNEQPTPCEEQQADCFASELLAPLTVLQFCGASSALEIERLCGISKQAAEVKFRELTRLRRADGERYHAALRRGDQPPASLFLLTEDNRELLRQFSPFISMYLSKRSPHDGYWRYLEALNKEPMAI